MNIIKGVTLTFRSIATMACLITVGLAALPASVYAKPSRSTNIALTQNGQKLVAVNVDANSVTVFQVQNGGGSLRQLAEIPVGREPHCVAVRGNNRAYVTNAQTGSVWVINLNNLKVIRKIPVGTEPRGCALTPSGSRLFVANHTAGTVSVIDTSSQQVIGNPIGVGGNPMAIAITDKGGSDDSQTVFVTDFFGRLIEGGPGEGFDNGKEGIVSAFTVGNPTSITRIKLSPLADAGFTANRREFCNNTDTTDPDPANQTFCPDTNITNPDDPIIAQDPQGCFPNQLHAAVIRRGRLFLPNICAQPEPPVQFRVNVQAVVHVVDTNALSEVQGEHVNLNAQITTEPDPADPTTSLGKLFGNDIVAIDWAGGNFLIVSRGGNYVLRARLGGDGKLNIGAPNVVRFQTGHIPTGVVIARGGRFAFVNNEVGHSVSILDLQGNTVVKRDESSSKLPEPGSFAHSVLLGKLVFFTGLGVPDNGLVGRPIRSIDPLLFRGKQSNNAWSTCASCHPAGLSDGVTWIFGDGPRNTLPLDALYSKVNAPHDTRINNWSAVRDSVTDFNNNSRGVQGGCGFASDEFAPGQCLTQGAATPANPAIFDHGLSQGASEALDFETQWAQTVRPLNQPKPANLSELDAGVGVFNDNCASCHGGAKWTKSQVIYLNNPALDKAAAAQGTPRDPGLLAAGNFVANQVVKYQDAKVDTGTLNFLEVINTFNAANAIEIRGAGAAIGQAPLGVLGFNVPSLLNTNYNAPYFHNGAAQTLEDVFPLHALGGGTIQSVLSEGDRNALLAFLKALDGRTPIFTSQTDIFKDPTQNLP
jgi:YVTN family beta-propeller protein